MTDISISKDALEKLRRRRQCMLLHDVPGPVSNSFKFHPKKIKPAHPHLAIKTKDKTMAVPGTTPVGHDVLHTHEEKVRNILKETVRIVPAESDIHEELRRTYDINFAVNAMDTLRQLSAMRVDLIFFVVKGWAAHPMIHCANRAIYPTDLDFDDALQRFYQDNPDSFYQPETFLWLVSSEEITDVFNYFDTHDRNRFTEITGWILKHGHFDQVVHVGHDRRPRMPTAV